MMAFEDRQDVEEWLEGLDADGFWREAEQLALTLPDRAECERQIAAGITDAATMLAVVKAMARLELVERHALRPRMRVPWHTMQ